MTDIDWTLPIELTEKILLNLDGGSLARASFVCKKWNDCFRNLTNIYNVWELCCKKEIPSEHLINIIDKVCPCYFTLKLKNIDWFLVFKCWYVWYKTERWNVLTSTLLESYDAQIKCLKTSGDWIIYGTVNVGKVMAYNHVTYERISIYRGHGVVDIDLYNTINFSLPLGKNFPHDGLLCLLSNYSVIRYSLNDMEQSVYHENLSGLKSLLEWMFARMRNYEIKMESVGLSYTKSDCWSKQFSCKKKIRVNIMGGLVILPKDQNLSSSEEYVECAVEVANWYPLNYNILFGISYTIFHVLFVVVDDKIKAYFPPDQLFTIKIVFMHCNMLFLGNNRGNVFVYRVKNKEDLLQFNFSRYIKKFEVSNMPITAIDVQYETANYNHEIPYLIVSTPSSIHKITFN